MFRGISNPTIKLDVVERELNALHLPGLQFRRVSVPNPHTGKPGVGLYIEVADWDEWRPTELSFYLMKLSCKLEPKNPFAYVSKADAGDLPAVHGLDRVFAGHGRARREGGRGRLSAGVAGAGQGLSGAEPEVLALLLREPERMFNKILPWLVNY